MRVAPDQKPVLEQPLAEIAQIVDVSMEANLVPQFTAFLLKTLTDSRSTEETTRNKSDRRSSSEYCGAFLKLKEERGTISLIDLFSIVRSILNIVCRIIVYFLFYFACFGACSDVVALIFELQVAETILGDQMFSHRQSKHRETLRDGHPFAARSRAPDRPS